MALKGKKDYVWKTDPYFIYFTISLRIKARVIQKSHVWRTAEAVTRASWAVWEDCRTLIDGGSI